MALFEQLLEAANVDLRIAAGEAVVVLYESAYDHDDEASLEMVSLREKKFVKMNLYKNKWIHVLFSFIGWINHT